MILIWKLKGLAKTFSARQKQGAVGTGIDGVRLRFACAFVLIGILSAGLWPFHSPRNAIRWLREGGVSVGEYGTAITVGAFKRPDSEEYGPCSLEVWLKPTRGSNSGTVLAFFQPGTFLVSFVVRQSLTDLELRRGALTRRPKRAARVYADDAFRSQQPSFFTIISGSGGTHVYSDGRLVGEYPQFKLSIQDLTGRLMIGNAPGIGDNWSGEMKGLAIYGRELSADEVVKSYASWLQHNFNGLTSTRNAFAVYSFEERSGNVVHNLIDTATDLQIPDRFFVLHKPFLELPWDEYYVGWSYWTNLGVNLVGFVPLGFFFFALFCSARIVERRLLAIISLGFAVSLLIEVLQAFLPTRKSGVTDLFTNTLGTALGAMSYRYFSLNDSQGRIARYVMAFYRFIMHARDS